MLTDKEKIVLYGAGMEGEKFYWKHKDEVEILYCADRDCNRSFHNIPVYALEAVKDDIINHKIIVAATLKTYEEIKINLFGLGLVEWEHFVWARAYGKKVTVLYGNCHTHVLKTYLVNNPYFEKEYYIKQVLVMEWEKELTETLLSHCSLCICQDIRENNKFNAPSAESLRYRVADACVFIKMINLYGFRAFFPQLYQRYHSTDAEEDNRFKIAAASHMGGGKPPLRINTQVNKQTICFKEIIG